jgi:hypothetical protein
MVVGFTINTQRTNLLLPTKYQIIEEIYLYEAVTTIEASEPVASLRFPSIFFK